MGPVPARSWLGWFRNPYQASYSQYLSLRQLPGTRDVSHPLLVFLAQHLECSTPRFYQVY